MIFVCFSERWGFFWHYLKLSFPLDFSLVMECYCSLVCLAFYALTTLQLCQRPLDQISRKFQSTIFWLQQKLRFVVTKCNIHLKDGHHKEVLEWAVSRNGSERWLLGLLPWLLARLSPLSYQVVVNFFWPQGSKPSRIWRGMFTFLLPLYWNVYFITLAIALGGNQFMDLLELEANTFPLVHILANLCPFLEFSRVFVRMVVDFGGPLMPPSWSLLQVDNFSRNWS